MAQDMNALTPVSSLPDKEEWGTIFGMAQQLVPTGFLPKAVDSPQKAAAIMLKGRELGVPPMYALSNITVIQGKPTANAEMMLALVKRAYGRDAVWVEKSTPELAKIGYLVHGKPRYYEFTIAMAQKAGLMSNQTWNKYPDAMLRARAISAVCRMEFPEVIGGMYAPGELGEDVRVDESTGEVISVDYAPRQSPQNQPQPAALSESSEDQKEKAMRRVHAVAGEYGISHDELHLWALDRKKQSVSDFTAKSLNDMASSIEADADKARAYFSKLQDVAELKAEGEKLSAQLDGESEDSDVIQGELVEAEYAHPNHGDS